LVYKKKKGPAHFKGVEDSNLIAREAT